MGKFCDGMAFDGAWAYGSHETKRLRYLAGQYRVAARGWTGNERATADLLRKAAEYDDRAESMNRRKHRQWHDMLVQEKRWKATIALYHAAA